jgi:hypothetical protein
MSRLIPILDLIELLSTEVVRKFKLSQGDQERFVQLQLCDLVSTTEINPFIRKIIEQVESITSNGEVSYALSRIQDVVFTN